MNLVALLNLGQTDVDPAFKQTHRPAAQKIHRRDRTIDRTVFPHAAPGKEKPKSAEPNQRAADLFPRERSGEAG